MCLPEWTASVGRCLWRLEGRVECPGAEVPVDHELRMWVLGTKLRPTGRAASALNLLSRLSVLRGAELEGFASAFGRISVVEEADRNLVCGFFRAYL